MFVYLIIRPSLLTCLLSYKLDGVTDLGWVASDVKQLLIHVGWRIAIQLNVGPRGTVDFTNGVTTCFRLKQKKALEVHKNINPVFFFFFENLKLGSFQRLKCTP